MKKGWEIKTLGEVVEFQRGLTYSKNDEVDLSSNIILRANNIDSQSNVLDLTELKYIRDTFQIPKDKKVLKGSVLICTASGSKSHLGKVALIDDEYDYAFGGFMGQLSPKNMLYSGFLFHLLTSDDYKNFINRLSDGVNINNLKFTDLKEYSIPLPPLLEQRRIVAILDNTFESFSKAKKNAETNLRNASELFQSYLKGLDAEKQPLGSLVGITTGKLDANAAKANGQYPFFTCSRDVFAIDEYAFDCEAILLAGNNAVGDFNVKHYKGKFNAYQRTYVITVNKEGRVLYRYLYFQMLKSLKEFKAQSVGAGTKFLKLGMIKDLRIALPSLSEQTSIVATLDGLSIETKKLEAIYQKKLSDLEELKKSVLQKAFNGELTAA
jgi:type I restriction enzyme S subunit